MRSDIAQWGHMPPQPHHDTPHHIVPPAATPPSPDTPTASLSTAAERAAGVTKNEQLPWGRRDHALFIAYAPADNPRYAIAQIVEHGGGGSAVAAPIARDILLYAVYGGLPPLSAYPPEQRGKIEDERARMPAAEAAPPVPLPPGQRRNRA